MSSMTMNDMKVDKTEEQFELFSPNVYDKNSLYYPGSNTIIVDSDDDVGDIGLGLENIVSTEPPSIANTPSQYSTVIDNLDLAHSRYVKSKKQQQNNRLARRHLHLNSDNSNSKRNQQTNLEEGTKSC